MAEVTSGILGEVGLWRRISSLVALPHSVFALPFALASFVLAASRNRLERHAQPLLVTTILVVVAVVSARTAAMAFNRLIDADVDKLNPRTEGRELPAGKLPKSIALALVVASAAVFILTAALLGKHCLVLAPVVLAILFFYSYTKRFTEMSHFALGLALAAAVGGAWWVLRPQVELTPIVLMVGVLTWVAGFDLLYSCQDVEFDRAKGLHSIPAFYGIDSALHISTVLHLAATALFAVVGLTSDLSRGYFWGLLFMGVFLVGQHYLISPRDLRRINHAFFTMNGIVSLTYFLLVLFTAP